MNRQTIEQGLAATEEVVDRIGAGQLARPTPCSDWDVAALLGHTVGVLRLHAACLRDEQPQVPLDANGSPLVDLTGEDPLKSYRAAAEEFVAAASAGDALERAHATPMGDLPGAAEATFVLMDVVVHGWDLARATQQELAVPAPVVDEVLGFVRQAIPDDRRVHLADAVAVDPAAPPLDQLVAFLGREP